MELHVIKLAERRTKVTACFTAAQYLFNAGSSGKRRRCWREGCSWSSRASSESNHRNYFVRDLTKKTVIFDMCRFLSPFFLDVLLSDFLIVPFTVILW